MNKETLIKGLNNDLTHEYQAVIMYTTYSAIVGGVHRRELRSFFQAEVPDELRHAQFLSDKISALGGTPVSKPADVPYTDEPQKMLENVLKAESDTIIRYVDRRKEAEQFGDYGLVNDIEDIISDETNHKEETEKLLRDNWER